MSRAGRVHFEGAVYHVYNRLARGEQAFSEEAEAQWFRSLLREVAERDVCLGCGERGHGQGFSEAKSSAAWASSCWDGSRPSASRKRATKARASR